MIAYVGIWSAERAAKRGVLPPCLPRSVLQKSTENTGYSGYSGGGFSASFTILSVTGGGQFQTGRARLYSNSRTT